MIPALSFKPPFSLQTCCSHVLNINYNCYSLVHSKRLLVQTRLLISLQAQGILGSCAGGRKHHGSPDGANGGGGGIRWVHRVRVVGLKFPEEPSAEAEPVYSRCQRVSHRLGGNSRPGAGPDARVSTSALEHLCWSVTVTSHGVGTTASASTTRHLTRAQVQGMLRPPLSTPEPSLQQRRGKVCQTD